MVKEEKTSEIFMKKKKKNSIFDCLVDDGVPFIGETEKRRLARKKNRKWLEFQIKSQRKRDKNKGKKRRSRKELKKEYKQKQNYFIYGKNKVNNYKYKLSVKWKTNYYKYISSDKWTERKKLYFKTNKHQCVCCKTTNSIHLHHITYNSLGNEEDKDLAPLCKTCHDECHKNCQHNDKIGFVKFVKQKRNKITNIK